MSDEIFGDRFVAVRKSAWHRKGIVIPEAIPVEEALDLARVTYPVRKETLYLPGNVDSGYVAIVRDPVEDEREERIFGVAKSYELVHITDIDFSGIPWPIETVGSLHHGAHIFLTFNLGDRKILGEDYEMYLSIVHPYVPGSSWKVMLTPIRIVCQNTLMLGESAARSTIAVSHTQGARARIDTAMLMAKAEASESQALERLKAMSKIRLTPEDVDFTLRNVFQIKAPRNYISDPQPGDLFAESAARRYQAALNWFESTRADVISLYERFNDERPELGGSGYALYNTIVEYADYYKGPRRSEDKVAEMALLGSRATWKNRAADTILALN